MVDGSAVQRSVLVTVHGGGRSGGVYPPYSGTSRPEQLDTERPRECERLMTFEAGGAGVFRYSAQSRIERSSSDKSK